MLLFLKKLLSVLILPPVALLVVIATGLVISRQRPRLGHSLIGISLTLLFALSVPAISNVLMRSIEDSPPLSLGSLEKAQAIVVLGSGIYAKSPEFGGIDTVNRIGLARIRYAAYLHRHSSLPILVSGGSPNGGTAEAEVMRDVLEQEFGVPVQWVESSSRTTVENASLSKVILAKNGIITVALVTDAAHMSRAKLEFERAGLIILPAPTVFSTDSEGFDLWLPSSRALNNSSEACRARLALLVARMN